MPVERLTDEMVLEYLDGNLSEKDRQAVEWAIALSEENRRLVAEYRALYGHLGTQQVYSMPPNFEHAVLDQIAIARRQSRWFTRLTIAAVATFVIAAGIVLSTIIDISPVATWLVQWSLLLPGSAEVLELFLSVVSSIAGFFSQLGIGAALFGVAGAILVLFHMLDAAVLGARYRGPAGS